MIVENNPFMSLADKNPLNDPVKVAALIRKSAEATKDNAPSAQATTNLLPQASLDTLTSNFDVRRIPLNKLSLMIRDPVIGFGLFFIRAHLMRARWTIKCSDPQIAAFVDNALREIYLSLISAFINKLAYGYQGIVKRFTIAETLDWTYVDKGPDGTGDPTESLVWDEGSIGAVVWKPVVSLPPEAIEPRWNSTGEFDGIKFKPSLVRTQGGAIPGGDQEFDVLHSLWFTNEKESVFGSLWGYPRIGYAYRFWWSFWFNWGLADRHFEKDADPAMQIYFPPNYKSPDGTPAQTLALDIGDRLRSGSTVALPGGLVMGADGQVKPMREWEIKPLENAGNFDIFQPRFDQLRTFMLSAIMVPDEAFKAAGGTAGYASTTSLQDSFAMSMVVLMQEFDFDLNRYFIPQLVAANFPDRPGIKATKVTKGFDSTDIELAKTIMTGIANKDASILNIDIPEMMEALGIPQLSPMEIAAQKAEKEAQAQAEMDAQRENAIAAAGGGPQVPAKPEATPAKVNQAGVTKTGLYEPATELITVPAVSDSTKLFFEDLKRDGFLDDMSVWLDAARLQSVWKTSLGYDYNVAKAMINEFSHEGELQLDETFTERLTRRITNRTQDTLAHTRRVLLSIMNRASTIELERAKIDNLSWSPNESEAARRYLEERADFMIKGITETTNDEIRKYLADMIDRGVPSEQMPGLLQNHFNMFADWRADRIVKTEIGRAYNIAVLYAGRDAGISEYQLVDGIYGAPRSDEDCIKRNGTICNFEDAMSYVLGEHPNGTLQVRIPIPA